MVLGKLSDRVDLASLAVFRILFGMLMVVATVRFWLRGWIENDFVRPRSFFHYWGLSFVHPWSGHGMYVHFAIMGGCALLVMLGLFYRGAIVLFALTFTWAHLCDVTIYLNHYYLVSLLSLLMCFLPLDRALSLRVILWPADARPFVHAWVLWLLRFQIGVVYVFGGLAKLGSDWLLRGEPLHIWLVGDADLPLLAHVARAHWLALAFGWAGMLFDLSIVPLLSWRRTRRLAFLVAVVFHGMTGVLFPIGMFPWIMTAGATLFFDPAWPRRFVPARGDGVASKPLGGVPLLVVGAYALVQLVMPLRHFAYPGNTLWTEEGFRYAWRVMLIDKSGDLELDVVDRDGHRSTVEARDYLTVNQRYQCATQPDLVLQLAHLVAEDFTRRGRGPVKVYAHDEVSWNGRRHAPMVDPTVDLAAESDGLLPKRWILPAPAGEPRW